MTAPYYIESERRGRDRADKPEYKVRMSAAFCFSKETKALEYYHNSSWLEHGGAPDAAAKTAFVYAIDAYIKRPASTRRTRGRSPSRTWRTVCCW